MSHQLVLIQNGTKKNITQMVGNLAWSSDVDSLGEQLTFDYAYNDTAYINRYDIIKQGDIIALINGEKVLHHYIVIKEDAADRFKKSYTCFDYAWYLNKNKVIMQFNKIAISKAIEKLCDKVSVKHSITNIPTLVTKIYKEDTVSDIINDLLEQATQESKNKYRLEMVDQTLTIKKQTDLLINPKIRLSDNTPLFAVTTVISNPSRSSSIEDMKNKIIVVTSDDKSTKIYAESTDTASVKKYGQLTEVVTLDDKNASQARNIAKNTLATMNKVAEDISLDLLGHDDIKAGRLIDINEPITGIKGRYLIKTANHSVSNGIHKVSVRLEAN